MPAPKLTTYKFRVFGGSEDEPAEFEVHGVGRDVQKAESLFADKGWGSTQTRPMTSAAAVSYFAMLRRGEFEGTWDEFESWYLSIEPLDTVTERPTVPEPETASP